MIQPARRIASKAVFCIFRQPKTKNPRSKTGGSCGLSKFHSSLLVVSRIAGIRLVENLVAQRAGAVDESVARVVHEANVRPDDRIAPGGIGDDNRDIGVAI